MSSYYRELYQVVDGLKIIYTTYDKKRAIKEKNKNKNYKITTITVRVLPELKDDKLRAFDSANLTNISLRWTVLDFMDKIVQKMKNKDYVFNKYDIYSLDNWLQTAKRDAEHIGRCLCDIIKEKEDLDNEY